MVGLGEGETWGEELVEERLVVVTLFLDELPCRLVVVVVVVVVEGFEGEVVEAVTGETRLREIGLGRALMEEVLLDVSKEDG